MQVAVPQVVIAKQKDLFLRLIDLRQSISVLCALCSLLVGVFGGVWLVFLCVVVVGVEDCGTAP